MMEFELWRIIYKYNKTIRKERKQKIKTVREFFKIAISSLKDIFPKDFNRRTDICGSHTLKELFGTEDLELVKDVLHRSFKRCRLTLIEDMSSIFTNPCEKLAEKRWYIVYGNTLWVDEKYNYNYPRIGYLVGKE